MMINEEATKFNNAECGKETKVVLIKFKHTMKAARARLLENS